jgi:predicted RND superfamily exporter protein
MLLARPRLTLLIVGVLTGALLFVGLRFHNFDTAPDTIVDPGSAAFRHEIQFENTFGADPLVILITTDVKALFAGTGLQQENQTEANLATQDNQKRGVQSVYGPASFATITGYTVLSVGLAQLQQAQQAAQQKGYDDAKAAGKSEQDAQAAGTKAASDAGNAFIADQSKQHPELTKIGIPSADNSAWMTALYINPDTGQPKPKFSAFVPDSQHLLITARLDPNVTNSASIDNLVASVKKTFHDSPVPSATLVVSGVPVLQNAIGVALRRALLAGMLVGAISMLVLLMIALRGRTWIAARAIPVVAGLLTVAMLSGAVSGLGYLAGYMRSLNTFGAPTWQSILATFTLALNPATLAAFPIALGLAVDYGVQFLYRYTQVEDRAAGLVAARIGAGRATRRAVICTVIGLLALMISNIPMVRQFGITMILGAALAWVVARVLTLAALKAWPRLAAGRVKATTEAVDTQEQAAKKARAKKAAALLAAEADEDDVALFGLSSPAGPSATEPEPARPVDVQPATEVEAVTAAAGQSTDGESPPQAGEWVAASWAGGAIRVLGAEPSASRRSVAAAEARTEGVTARISATAPEATPSPAAPRISPKEASTAAAGDTSPADGGQAWERRWEAVDDQADDLEEEGDENRPRTPGAIPAMLAQFARRRSTWVLAPALVVALAGWIAFPFSTYQTDPEKLVSPNLPAFRDVNAIRSATGSSGELDFILSGPDVTSQEALKWVTDLQTTVQRQSDGRIKPINSLASLLTNVNGGQPVNADQEKAYLGLLPGYVTNALVDPQRHLARVAFGLSPDNIEAQRQVIDNVIHQTDAPANYSFYAAGFSYLGIQGLDSLQSGQLLLNVTGAALVLAALFAIYRRPRWALMAWLPTLLVAGWSTAVLFALRQPLTPMTAVLGALVVAFGTEFAILWLERYREAQADGIPAGAEAAEAASRAAGPGIILSGAALTFGFLALTIGGLPFLSQFGFDLPMVRDFGLVAALDMVLAVVASLVVLPAMVVRVGLVETRPIAPLKQKVRKGKAGKAGARKGKKMVTAAEADAQAG